jgi:hypothetical protein
VWVFLGVASLEPENLDGFVDPRRNILDLTGLLLLEDFPVNAWMCSDELADGAWAAS